MTLLQNTEFFKTGNSKRVKVTVVFDVDKDADVPLILENGAGALDYYANNKVHKAWARSIEIKEI